MHKDPIHSLFIGSKQLKLPSCHSTNAVASDLLAEKETVEGTVVIADHQTAGRGQRGNHWESQPGMNLTLSVILKPGFIPISRQFDLTVATSLALVQTLADIGLPQAQIKWPNDIYYKNSKIAGILIENTVRSNKLEWAILGIGLNVNQTEFSTAGATSIKLEIAQDLELNVVLQTLLRRLNKVYSKLKSRRNIRNEYTDRLMWLGESRVFYDPTRKRSFSGKINGVNPEGKLLLEVNGQEYSYDLKEVAFVM